MLSYFCHQAAQAPFHCTALRRTAAEVYRRAANFLPVQLNCYHLAGKTARREQPNSLRHGFHQRTRQMQRERALMWLLGPPGATHSRPGLLLENCFVPVCLLSRARFLKLGKIMQSYFLCAIILEQKYVW